MKIAHIHVWDQTNKGDRGIVLAVQEQLRTAFPQVKILDFPVEVLKKVDPREINRINQTDLIVLGGGGIFYNYFLPFSADVIQALQPPLVIYGVGYIREIGAPPLKKEARQSILQLVKKAALVGVRENYTKRFLIRSGFPATRIKVIGDPAFILKEAGQPLVKPNVKAGLRIGLNLNYSGWLGFGRWREDILDAYRKTAEFFQNKYGAQIYYLQHHPGEKAIYPELKIKNLSVVDLAPAAQKGFYSQLDLVIGMMLHSVVMAAGALTPEINVAYDIRNRNFAKFIGCPELVVELPDLRRHRLEKLAQEVISRRTYYQSKFVRVKARISKNISRFLEDIKKLV